MRIACAALLLLALAPGAARAQDKDVARFGCHSDASDADLERLRQRPELREVHVLSSKITDAGLEHLRFLPKLEVLALNTDSITDKGLEHVGALEKVRTLSLARLPLTAKGYAPLK